MINNRPFCCTLVIPGAQRCVVQFLKSHYDPAMYVLIGAPKLYKWGYPRFLQNATTIVRLI